MDSTIQPILCCIGEAGAVKPTQFLMERAMAAAHCDWRVITVEVGSEELVAAVQGLQVMKFAAIRFFASYQERAAKFFPVSPSSSPWVTSAMRTATSAGPMDWAAWDNQGFGLLSLLPGGAFSATQPSASLSSLIWMDGDSRMTRSLDMALRTCDLPASQIVWSDSRLTEDATQHPSDSGDVAGSVAQPQAEQTTQAAAIERIRNFLLAATSPCQLVLVGDDLTNACELLGQLPAEKLSGLWLASNRPLTNGRVRKVCDIESIVVLTASEMLIAAEAYDFRRWTGREVDLDLLRDAYDEYVDF